MIGAVRPFAQVLLLSDPLTPRGVGSGCWFGEHADLSLGTSPFQILGTSWPHSAPRGGGALARIFGENMAMPARSFEDANVLHRLIRAVAVTKVGRALFKPTAHRLDQFVSRLTGGKRSFAEIAAGLPAVLLTTTGAKSGKPRTVALLGIPHPEGVAVVASNFGAAINPGWYHNLKANHVAIVTVEGDTWQATARIAGPVEREEIWARGIDIFPGLTKEQAWAGDRHIAAVVLARG